MSGPADDQPARGDTLASLCQRAGGWAFEERADGSLSIDLGVRDGFVSALVTEDRRGLEIEATLFETLPTRGPGRDALAGLMRRADACFRGIRSVLETRAGESRARFEARLAGNASGAEFARALGAVAIATRHCALEAEALVHDERLARLYLERVERVERDVPGIGPVPGDDCTGGHSH